MNQIDRAVRSVAIGILSCSVFLVPACAPDSDKPLGEAQSAARGAEGFDYNCGFCHGADGRGPTLSELRSLSRVERRGKIINHPISGQIPQRLSAKERSDLNHFLNSERNLGDP